MQPHRDSNAMFSHCNQQALVTRGAVRSMIDGWAENPKPHEERTF